MSSILTVKKMSKIYKSGKGIRDFNFELKKGKILGIIGLNGAGKSTLISCIIGFLNPDKGELEYDFDGKKYATIKPELLDHLGIVSSEYGYPNHFTAKTVDRILKRSYTNWDSKKFFEILKHIDLDPKVRAGKYSTGMKTKLACAVALAHNSKILILDEATRGLDVKASARIRELLWEHVQSGENSIILTSHIMGEIERMSDSIMLIEDGNMVFTSEKDEIMQNNKMFQMRPDEYEKIAKSDIQRVRNEGIRGVYVIAHNADEFSKKYALEPMNATLDEVIIMLLEGEAA